MNGFNTPFGILWLKNAYSTTATSPPAMIASSAARAPISSSPDGHSLHAVLSEKRVKFVEHSEQNGPSCPSAQPPIPPVAFEDPSQLFFDGHGSGRTEPLSALGEERKGGVCSGTCGMFRCSHAESECAVVMSTQPTPSTGHKAQTPRLYTLAHE